LNVKGLLLAGLVTFVVTMLALPACADEADVGPILEPQVIESVPPDWPTSWIGRIPPGEVSLLVTIGTDGTVTKVEVLRKDHERYVEPSVNAVKQWRFKPATREGEAMEMGMVIVMRFESNFRPFEMPPVLAKRLEPDYPRALLEQQLDGEVALEVRIDETGAVVAARVVRSDHPEFSKAAVAAVRQWRYDPAVVQGELAKSTAEVKLKFRWKKAAKATQAAE
jgi:protein TonB